MYSLINCNSVAGYACHRNLCINSTFLQATSYNLLRLSNKSARDTDGGQTDRQTAIRNAAIVLHGGLHNKCISLE